MFVYGMRFELWMRVGCPCPPIRNDIVNPRHLLHSDCETQMDHVFTQTNAISKTNKAGYITTPVVCGWAGAIFEATRPFGQGQ